MGADQNLFGKTMFTPIDFSTEKIGIVVGNGNLAVYGYIEVFIPELMVNSVPQKSSSKEINTFTDQEFTLPDINNILNQRVYNPISLSSMDEDVQSRLSYNSSVNSVNFIACYPKLIGGYSWNFNDQVRNPDTQEIIPTSNETSFKQLPEYIQHLYRPTLGSKVLVHFYHGDPKLPYFEYKEYMHFSPVSMPVPSNNDPIKNGDVTTTDPNQSGGFKETGYYRLIKYTSPELSQQNMLMIGGDVLKARRALVTIGYVFSTATIKSPQYDLDMMKAVADFQSKHKLKVDGIIGPITFSALMDVSKIK